MRFLTKKSTIQKIILALVVVILFNFAIPVQSDAASIFEKMGRTILEQLLKLLDSVRRCSNGVVK